MYKLELYSTSHASNIKIYSYHVKQNNKICYDVAILIQDETFIYRNTLDEINLIFKLQENKKFSYSNINTEYEKINYRRGDLTVRECKRIIKSELVRLLQKQIALNNLK